MYAAIRNHITHGAGTYLGLPDIAENVGGSTRTVTRSVAALEAADLLVVGREPGIQHYTLVITSGVPSIRSLLWRKTGRAYAAEVTRRRRAYAEGQGTA